MSRPSIIAAALIALAACKRGPSTATDDAHRRRAPGAAQRLGLRHRPRGSDRALRHVAVGARRAPRRRPRRADRARARGAFALLPGRAGPDTNDDPTSWCVTTSPIGTSGDVGTPGTPNDPC